jgi:hypothetical protein
MTKNDERIEEMMYGEILEGHPDGEPDPGDE